MCTPGHPRKLMSSHAAVFYRFAYRYSIHCAIATLFQPNQELRCLKHYLLPTSVPSWFWTHNLTHTTVSILSILFFQHQESHRPTHGKDKKWCPQVLMDVPAGNDRINGDRINGLFHLLINLGNYYQSLTWFKAIFGGFPYCASDSPGWTLTKLAFGVTSAEVDKWSI